MQKQQLRKEIMAARNALTMSDRNHKDLSILTALKQIIEILTSKHIFCHVSMGSETDTHQFINWALHQGKQLSIPKIDENNKIIAVNFPGWSKLHPGKLGILEPDSSTDISSKADVCIIPGIGFTEEGIRLGQGGGYYDKWLAKHSVKYCIAPTYDCQVASYLPANEFDEKVDIIVTESRVIKV
jgi:5-formyltetrahydrofolate cyclo-ligase